MIVGMANPMAVLVEKGSKKVFVSVVDWPGWCRAGKDEEAALAALAEYAARYRSVAEAAGVRFPKTAGDAFAVAETLPGNATTDFGAPGAIAKLDREKLTRAGATRQAALVEAAWSVFDAIYAKSPASLRKGPRGGGRDRDKMADHVLSAEAGYARTLDVKHQPPAVGDDEAIAALRAAIIEVLGAPSDGTPRKEKGWPVRYAARRIAWHVLDHAWEMEDRS